MSFVPSLAQTFETALAHHRRKRWAEALSVYRALETRQPNSEELIYLIIDVLEQQGALHDAHLEKQRLRPERDLEQELTLGHAFLRVASYDAAWAAFDRALIMDPENMEALLGLAQTAEATKDFDKAINPLNLALDIDPESAPARLAMARIFLSLGQPKRCHDLISPILFADPTHTAAGDLLLDVLPHISFEDRDPHMDACLVALLERTDIVASPAVSQAICKLMDSDPTMSHAIQCCLVGRWSDFFDLFVSGRLNDFLARPLIPSLLKAGPLEDAKLIALYMGVRRSLLKFYLLETHFLNWMPPLVSAIAVQSQSNGFLRPAIGSEKQALNRLTEITAAHLEDVQTGIKDVLPDLCLVGMYQSLLSVPNMAKQNKTIVALAANTIWHSVIQDHISDPLTEQKLTKSFKSLSQPKDPVGQKIAAQYQDHPTPRWSNTSFLPRGTCGDWLHTDLPDSPVPYSLDLPSDVLVAGCGTGQNMARLAHLDIRTLDAVDLSVWNLAYAARKLQDTYAPSLYEKLSLYQADLHDLRRLEKRYNIVIADGTVAETANPARAIRSLRELVSEDGMLHLTLPSKLAHKAPRALKQHVIPLKLRGSSNDVIALQREVWREDAPKDIIPMRTHPDFHSVGSCVHLCFSAQRHLFTLQEVADLLALSDLKLAGLCRPNSLQNRPDISLPDPTDLDRWSLLETRHPSIFADGYRLWAYLG